jgi:hypothetical protein
LELGLPLILKKVSKKIYLIKNLWPIKTSWMSSFFKCCLKLSTSTLYLAMPSTTFTIVK